MTSERPDPSNAASDAEPRPLRSYGRIRSRAIKPRQAALMDSLLPAIRLNVEAGPIDPKSLAPEAREVWLEIGFGGGEHLAGQAQRRPDVLILGAEPFENGVASLLRHIEEADLKNVRLHPGDARDLVAALPEGGVDRIFVLFPDPWPKERHRKRRLINARTAADLAALLKVGGRLRFATDWADYAERALETLSAEPRLAWTATAADDWRVPPADHVTTRYQEKGLGDCAPVFLDFVRI